MGITRRIFSNTYASKESEDVKYGLGIDAGGTYTDVVIYDFQSNSVLNSAKAITEREDLKRGINNGLGQLPLKLLKQVEMVALSTTLATNACVEGKGSRASLILIGCDRGTVTKYGHQYGLPDVQELIFIEGGHTYDGDVEKEPDWHILKKKVLEIKDKTDAFAVVELSGTMNPEYEIKAKNIIMKLTNMPVVYANEVSKELNFMKRAASAIINAQLIPLINEFLDAVKDNLKERQINAPMVIVRGDGSLMSEEYARNMPVETLLSGPAASVIGAVNLGRKKDCIVVDMGGTTSDIAIVEGGSVKFEDKGISIGKWQTGTRSISMKPVGLGGDSLITFDKNDHIGIFPFRAAPLSWLSFRWPNVLREMEGIYEENKIHTNSLCEFFYLVKDISSDSYYDQKEIAIIKALKDGPLSITKLAEAAETSIYELRFKRLEQNGIIMRSALTPTDIMHLSGDFIAWDVEGARLGSEIMANRLNMTLNQLIHAVGRKIKQKLYLNIMALLFKNDNKYFKDEDMYGMYMDLVLKGYHDTNQNEGKKKEKFSVDFSTDYTLIGIGAPIHIYLPDVAKTLRTECIIPQNAEVANAVGAITGNISANEVIKIRSVYKNTEVIGYNCHTSVEKKEFSTYEEALKWSKVRAESLARKSAQLRGAGEVNIIVDVKESSIVPDLSEDSESDNSILLETAVTAVATGILI